MPELILSIGGIPVPTGAGGGADGLGAWVAGGEPAGGGLGRVLAGVLAGKAGVGEDAGLEVTDEEDDEEEEAAAATIWRL